MSDRRGADFWIVRAVERLSHAQCIAAYWHRNHVARVNARNFYRMRAEGKAAIQRGTRLKHADIPNSVAELKGAQLRLGRKLKELNA